MKLEIEYALGFKEDDGLLNECGVCTKECDTEYIDLMKDIRKGAFDECIVTIVRTPDGHYLEGVDVCVGTTGQGYAPSLLYNRRTGKPVCYDTKKEAILHAVKGIAHLLETHPQWEKIQETIAESIVDADQLSLF